MGRLDDPERQEAVEQRQPSFCGGGRSREQQHDTGEKREDRQHARCQLLCQPVEGRADPRRLCLPVRDFVGNEHNERNAQWQQVIHGAVDDERRQQRRA